MDILERRLAQELAAAYRVLECTIPAMLRELYRGGVSSLDQLCFHESVGKLSEFTDIIDYDDGQGKLQEDVRGGSCIRAAIDYLEDEVIPALKEEKL